MSTETLKMCDVQNCKQVASHTLKYMTVGVWDINQEQMRFEDGKHIWTSKDVDLCGPHEHDYRSNLPEIKLNQMKEVKS